MSGETSWLARLRSTLGRTREALTARVDALLAGPLDETFFTDLEEALIVADVGAATSARIVDRLRREAAPAHPPRGHPAGARREPGGYPARTAEGLRTALAAIIREHLGPSGVLRLDPPPAAIIIIGVNGSGKTTTIGKLAHRLRSEGRRVLLAAGDTFRAAAIEQLEQWGERAGIPVIRHQVGADPAAVVFDAAQAAQARHADVLIVDTAGRLHTKVNLMEELKKVDRVLARALPDAPVERLLVLDATTGQNGLAQARAFNEAVGLTGVVLTKLDGTAKGGIVLAVADALRVPIVFIGTGEGLDDLAPFDPGAFATALLAP